MDEQDEGKGEDEDGENEDETSSNDDSFEGELLEDEVAVASRVLAKETCQIRIRIMILISIRIKNIDNFFANIIEFFLYLFRLYKKI